jgi:uncharacterized protein
MDMQAIIADWKENAKRNQERNFALLHSLKMEDDRPVDRAARQLHQEAFSVIDCTQCANCCKHTSPLFRKADIRRIAKHLGMTTADFTATHLEADEQGDLYLKTLPCPFLDGDNRCTIYELRPVDCADYPHTHKKGFSYRTYMHSGNALVCPAVFYIVERMRTERGRWRGR